MINVGRELVGPVLARLAAQGNARPANLVFFRVFAIPKVVIRIVVVHQPSANLELAALAGFDLDTPTGRGNSDVFLLGLDHAAFLVAFFGCLLGLLLHGVGLHHDFLQLFLHLHQHLLHFGIFAFEVIDFLT